MPKLTVDVDASEVVVGFPVINAGNVACTVGIPEVKQSKKGNVMIVFPLKLVQDAACTITDDSGASKQVMAGGGKPMLRYYCTLSPESIKNGSVAAIENACKMKGVIHKGKELDYSPEILRQFTGKQVIAVVTNTIADNGTTMANVQRLLPA